MPILNNDITNNKVISTLTNAADEIKEIINQKTRELNEYEMVNHKLEEIIRQ